MNIICLSEREIKKCITMTDAISAMESAFLQLARQQVILPLRTAIPIKNEHAISLSMPAYLEQEQQLGIKVVSLFPNNFSQKIPTINGLILLLDAKTGQPKALMDASYLTALRTGAISGLATRLLARKDASHVAIMGSGSQAMTQLEAIAHVRNITHVSIWSRTHEHAISFAKQIEHQFEIQVFADSADAVKEADIICTATNSTSPFIHYDDIKPDAHINAIGSHTRNMREIASDVFKQAITVVDQIEAALSEAGEIIHAIESNVILPDSLLEIGPILSDASLTFKDHLTVFKSVGLAIQDISVAEMVYKNAIANQMGQHFDLSQ
ncbi:MAG: ornithine cyclodeaminase family protein [Legionella sp.]|nr:ornithine cyclodeaminase family protein [Legionella sp.]